MTVLMRSLCLIIFLMLVPGAAIAQDAADSTQQADEISQARDALIKILEDPDTRAALIKQLSEDQQTPDNGSDPNWRAVRTRYGDTS